MTGKSSLSPRLDVYLLGQPVVEWAAHPLSIPRRQARALLYRLAVQREPVHREKLCFLFWPDTPESSARRKLTRLLSLLRHSLSAQDLLLTQGDRIGLHPDLVWSDVLEFAALRDRHRPNPDVDDLHNLVQLYRGPFLGSFSLPNSPDFESWASQERQVWERLYLEGLLKLIEELTCLGELARAIDFARRYLMTDPLAEDVHRRLIELYSISGDRNAALSQYEQCVRILEQELGVDPLPQTLATYQAALQGQSTLGAVAEPVPVSVHQGEVDIPLFGRDEDLGQLEQAYARAGSGQGETLLISGEQGIGKSYLLHAFTSRLKNEAIMLQSTADLSTQDIPYHLLTQALRPILQNKPPIQGLDRTWLSEASRLFPELRAHHPDLPPPLPDHLEEARTLLFEALYHLIVALPTTRRTLVLILDDLQWADKHTLRWLAYLAGRIQDRNVLILGAFLEDEKAAISDLYYSLRRRGIYSELHLTGVDQSTVQRILQHFNPAWGDQEHLANRLRALTAGNPLYLMEILRAMMESNQVLDEFDAPHGVRLPERLLQTIKLRLERLDPVARQVLETIAVIGPGADYDIIRHTAARSETETLISLDGLVSRGLLIEQEGEHRLRHTVIQSAVYQNLTHWRRRLLHRRVAETLEKLDPQNYARLAWHFERADIPGKAAANYLQAGRSIKNVFAHEDAKKYFDQALELLHTQAASLRAPSEIETNRRMRIQALAERGWVFRLLGNMEAYKQDLRLEAELAQKLGDKSTLAHLRCRQAIAHRWSCRFDRALEVAEEGILLSRETGDALLEARCLRELGIANREIGEFEQARIALERALEQFKKIGETLLVIHTLGNLSTLYGHQGQFEDAMNMAHQALEICEQENLNYERRLPLGDLGAALVGLGDAHRAQTFLHQSLEMARQTSDRTQEIFCLIHLGWLSLCSGHFNQALEQLNAALDLADRIGSRNEQGLLHLTLSEANYQAGNHPRAMQHARYAIELVNSQGRPIQGERAARLLARLTSQG